MLINFYFNFQEQTPSIPNKGQSPAKMPIGGEGILTPELPITQTSPFLCNSLEDAYLVLWTVSEKRLELSSAKEKELHFQLQELIAKREEGNPKVNPKI